MLETSGRANEAHVYINLAGSPTIAQTHTPTTTLAAWAHICIHHRHSFITTVSGTTSSYLLLLRPSRSFAILYFPITTLLLLYTPSRASVDLYHHHLTSKEISATITKSNLLHCLADNTANPYLYKKKPIDL